MTFNVGSFGLFFRWLAEQAKEEASWRVAAIEWFTFSARAALHERET